MSRRGWGRRPAVAHHGETRRSLPPILSRAPGDAVLAAGGPARRGVGAAGCGELGILARPREECGLFGVWGHRRATGWAIDALWSLQHRGQDGAGIAACRPGGELAVHKGSGLVAEVFSADRVQRWQIGEATAAIGHVRYSTVGDRRSANVQPLLFRVGGMPVAVAHNGQLVDGDRWRDRLERDGVPFVTTGDSEIIGRLAEWLLPTPAAAAGAGAVREALVTALSAVRGAFSVVALTPAGMLAARDPWGIRPLVLGEADGAWLVASETCALDAVGARTVREVAPGEWLWVNDDGVTSGRLSVATNRPGGAFCLFEYIYFARPDSRFGGRSVYQVRKELGRRLARESPVEADVVVGVPDSSLPAAAGFSEESGIPHEPGLVKNRYVGRTFIGPDQRTRSEAVRLKLNPVPEVVAGRRVVLVDDSLVRGTTVRWLVQALRGAGAREVHLRISASPYRYPCHYGIATGHEDQLLAASHEPTAIAALVGADSLSFLSLPAMVAATGRGADEFCLGCFTGQYPIPVETTGGDETTSGGRATPGGRLSPPDTLSALGSRRHDPCTRPREGVS